MSTLNSSAHTRAPVTAGLAAGAAAAVAAVLVSLALKSPDDVFINSATVGVAALVLGLVAGVGWKWLGRTRGGTVAFGALWVAGALAAVGLAVSSESVLEGSIGYAVPIALLCFAITGGLTRLLSPVLVGRWWVSLVAVAVAIGMSVTLAGRRAPAVAPLVLPEVVVAATVAAPARNSIAAPVVLKPPARSPGTYTGVDFVVGQGSKATFTVRETLARMPLPNDAVLSTSALTGEVHLDGRPSTINLDLQRLSSDQPLRDKYVRTKMFPNDRVATFNVDDVRPLTDGSPPPEGLKGTVSGSLTLRGGTFPLTFQWEGRDEGSVLYLLGRAILTWKDVGLDPPSSSAIVSTDDTIAVEVMLVARPH